MRAEKITGGFYEFTALDAIAQIGDDEFVLTARKWSPRLILSTLTLGSDIGIFEGDIVNNEWLVKHKGGFFAENKNTGEQKYLYEFDNPVVTGFEKQTGYRRIVFKCRNYCFGASQFRGKYHSGILIAGIRGSVAVKEIQQNTGVHRIDDKICTPDHTFKGMKCNKELFLGDMYEGLPLILCYGRVCVQYPEGVYDICDNKFIRKLEELDNEEQRN